MANGLALMGAKCCSTEDIAPFGSATQASPPSPPTPMSGLMTSLARPIITGSTVRVPTQKASASWESGACDEGPLRTDGRAASRIAGLRHHDRDILVEASSAKKWRLAPQDLQHALRWQASRLLRRPCLHPDHGRPPQLQSSPGGMALGSRRAPRR